VYTKQSFLLAFSLFLWAASSALAQPPAASLEARWADLGNTDEGKATRALLALAATPKETTAYLKDNLKPVKADPDRVKQLLKALDSPTFVVRNQAMMELEYYNKYIKSDLEAALKGNAGVETRMRIQQLLDKLPKEKKEEPKQPMPRPGAGKSISVMTINGQTTILIDGQPIDFSKMGPPTPPPGPPQQWLRAVKAVTLLEHLATPEAREILQSIGNGESDALPTIAAKEALGRLKKE
jgi:hypothetical protein